MIQNSPRGLGYEQNDWDGKLLSYHIAKQYHLTLKVRRCQYLFHELGFTLQRPRAIATGDPVAQAEFKKNRCDLGRKNPIPRLPSGQKMKFSFTKRLVWIRKWSRKGQQPPGKSPPGRDKIGFFGMVNLTTGRLLTEQADVVNQQTFRSFLEEALSRMKKRKMIIIVDNAKWHHAKSIQAFVQKHSDRMELLFLPPYSPELNTIERAWKLTRK